MLVSEIITTAMRKLGAIASGEVITVEEQQDGLSALQSMLRSWSAEKINVFSSVTETHTLTGGTGSYTWGSGGDIDSVRPNQVTNVTIVDSSDVTHGVGIISEGKYRSITLKTTSARPDSCYVDYGFPLVTLYLYPVPSNAETLTLVSLKPFTETSSFDDVDSTLSMPVIYEEPIIYNLAVRLAPEHGKAIPPSVVAIARVSYDRIILRNAGNYVESVAIVIPAGLKGGYNINTDM